MQDPKSRKRGVRNPLIMKDYALSGNFPLKIGLKWRANCILPFRQTEGARPEKDSNG
jgi:hypothetical protein